MLSGISRKRSIRSNPYWFTEFCNSQCLSHFAAPFIVVRAEASIADNTENESTPCFDAELASMVRAGQTASVRRVLTQPLRNDPFAGSPTKTLLRLLQPLDNVERKKFLHSFPISGSDGRCVQKAVSYSSRVSIHKITRHSY